MQNYGTPTYGSDIGHLPAGVTAAGIAADRATGGYWILKSNGGVDAFNAPWYRSLAWHVPAGQSMTGKPENRTVPRARATGAGFGRLAR